MNAIAKITESRPARQIVEDVVPILDTARFEHMQRIATIMANASLVPEALRTYKDGDNVYPLPFDAIMANCFLVVNQATRWGMDPFGVAQCLSIVKGKFCYEGKLVAAVLDARLGVALSYSYDDKPGDQLGVVVSGVVDGVTKTIEGTVAAWKTTGSGSPWNPATYKRQLAYRGAREWARIHKPALMLGAYTVDELDDLQDASRANRAREMAPPPPPPEPPAAALAPPAPPVEDATIISETAAGAPAPGNSAAQDAGSSLGNPAENDPAFAPGSDVSPDDILANLIDCLAMCQTVEAIHEGYDHLDVEADLSPFDGFVQKAREVKAAHLDRVERLSAETVSGPVTDSGAPPPPPADGEEDIAPSPPPGLEPDISSSAAYEAVLVAKLDAARNVDEYEVVRAWWTATRSHRQDVLVIKDHADIARLQGHFKTRKEVLGI